MCIHNKYIIYIYTLGPNFSQACSELLSTADPSEHRSHSMVQTQAARQEHALTTHLSTPHPLTSGIQTSTKQVIWGRHQGHTFPFCE